MNKVLIAIAVFMSVALSISSAFADDTAETVERKEVIRGWLAAGDMVARRTGNADASVIMRFLHEASSLGVPISHEEGLAIKLVEGAKDIPLWLVPLLVPDRGLSSAWKEIYDNNHLAAIYNFSPQPYIVLKEYSQFSQVWRGLILIHEGSHALAYAGDAFEGIENPRVIRTLAELYAYDLEITLVQQIGGQAYEELLQEEMRRLCPGYVQKNLITTPDYPLYKERLDQIFGPSNSDWERGVRGSIFWMNAIFRLIDEMYPEAEERQKRKADFLFTSYNEGILK